MGQSSLYVIMSYNYFDIEMKKVFDHLVRSTDAIKHLLSLRDSSHSVVEFSVELTRHFRVFL